MPVSRDIESMAAKIDSLEEELAIVTKKHHQLAMAIHDVLKSLQHKTGSSGEVLNALKAMANRAKDAA